MVCQNCGSETDNPKFCNKSCAASFNNKKFPKRATPDRFCQFCGEKLTPEKKWYKRTYCDMECSSKAARAKTLELVILGLTRNKAAQKQWIIENRLDGKERCEICSLEPIWNSKVLVLQIDHIDGNSDNNLPINLRLACPNCHTQTETWCGRVPKNTKRNRYIRSRRKLARVA